MAPPELDAPENIWEKVSILTTLVLGKATQFVKVQLIIYDSYFPLTTIAPPLFPFSGFVKLQLEIIKGPAALVFLIIPFIPFIKLIFFICK